MFTVTTTSPLNRQTRTRGLSIVGMLCTLSIVATMVGSAVPGMTELRQRKALELSASEFVSAVQTARLESRMRPNGAHLDVQAVPGGSCLVVHTGAAGACTCSADGSASCATGTDLLRMTTIATPAARLSPARLSLQFSAERGTVTPTATMKFIDTKGRALHQIVNIMGRTRSCSPEGAVAGYPAC
ncbi:MAG: hypothetical protein HY021_00285 [Burkholderiales bacterium]|nr:hypothetical protein [Burkholderiales bacterium]